MIRTPSTFIYAAMVIFTGRIDQAKARVEDAKVSRFAAQIEPDGRQPLEVGRTKAMHYSCMNLWALVNLASMGRSIGVDLWGFQTKDGRGLRQAFRFLEPYAMGESEWPYEQITQGGVAESIRKELLPLFSMSSTLMKTQLTDERLNAHLYLSPLAALKCPPIGYLKAINASN